MSRDGPAARYAGLRARLIAACRAVIRNGPAARAIFVRRAFGLFGGAGPAARAVLYRKALDRFAGAGGAEHREIAAALAAAIEAEDDRTAGAMAAMAWMKPDLRAEKVVSRRHRFLWICNPKVASRSIMEALLSADPEADPITGRTLEEIVTTRPEVRDYYRFAFIRHPCHRAFSCWADKYVRLARAGHPESIRTFVAPYYGVRPDMSFTEFCRWLDTPYGSDLFADRHWLSQHRQIRLPDGRLPDFVGRYEHLDADWKTVTERVGLPARPLPHANPRPETMVAEEHLDGETVALLERRYAEDFRLGGYGGP